MQTPVITQALPSAGHQQTASLYFADGRSDKEYHVELLAQDHGYVVNFRYGRRGGTLTCGSKTAEPVEFIQAQKIFSKLVQEKSAKGYRLASPCAADATVNATTNANTGMQDGENSSAVVTPASYQSLSAETKKHTGFVPQLLNAIPEEEARHLLHDPMWLLQEKKDGERRAIRCKNGDVIGINRKGFQVPLPQALADECLAITQQGDHHGAWLMDGELIGETLFVFDLHIHQGQSLHHLPWIQRIRIAADCFRHGRQIQVVPVAVTAAEKYELWEKITSAHGEGVVFKRAGSTVSEGRPNSGGDWLKFKFTATASCVVLGVNAGKRSVKLGLYPSAQTLPNNVGNVTIPPNHAIPATGDVVEVAYLYAYPGGSLFQPVYRGKRHDLNPSDCTTAQLKYKPASAA